MTARLFDGRGIVVPALALSAPIAYVTAREPLLALVGVAAILLLLLVLLRPEAVLLLLVAALPWEGLLHYPSETVGAVKILGLLLAVAWFFHALTGGGVLRLPPTFVPVLIFGMLVGISFVFSPDPESGIEQLLRYGLFMAFFFLTVQLVTERRSVLRVLRAIGLSTTGAALWGLVLWVKGDLALASGPIGDPNDFAYLIVTVLPLVGYLFIEERNRRGVWGICLAILVAGALATLSRGALVGLVALAVWAVLSGRVSMGGALTAVGSLLLVVVVAFSLWSPIINESVERKGKIAQRNTDSRLSFWEAAVKMSYDRPLVGVGPGRFGDESDVYLGDRPSTIQDPVAHSSYLEILAECGFPALLAFLAYLAGSWGLLRRGRREARAAGDVSGSRLATALQSAFVVAFVSGAFLSQELALPFWLIGALAAATAGAAERPATSPAAGRLQVTRAPA
jgi:putative inorganic carbon (hco3(-)) transporter